MPTTPITYRRRVRHGGVAITVSLRLQWDPSLHLDKRRNPFIRIRGERTRVSHVAELGEAYRAPEAMAQELVEIDHAPKEEQLIALRRDV